MMSQCNPDIVRACDRIFAEQNGNSRSPRKVSFREAADEKMDVQPPDGVDRDQDQQNHNNHNQRRSSLLNGRQRSDKAEKEGSDHDEPPMQMMDVEEEDEDDGRTVTMDKGKLQAIIDRLVQVTKDYPVQEMEE